MQSMPAVLEPPRYDTPPRRVGPPWRALPRLANNTRVVRRPLVAIGLLATLACTRQAVDLAGRGCGGDACADGYVCNPLTSACTARVDLGCNVSGAVCPTDLRDHDACSVVGSFVPCVDGTNGCESGCRLCDSDLSWSQCSCIGINCACFTSNGGVEVCDGFDNDCSGSVDDGVDVEGCAISWVDADGDGFGTGDSMCFCGLPDGRFPLDGDSSDSDPAINPDAGELCDGIDNNGDGSTLARETDDDGDGYVECSPWVGDTPGIVGGNDCNDLDPDIHPGALELCDGISNDCSGVQPSEVDKDGDYYVGCAPWVGTVPGIVGGGDCDTGDELIHPGAPEVFDAADNDCDTKIDECLLDCDCGSTLVSCYPLETVPTASDLGSGHVDAVVETGTGVLADGKVAKAYNVGPSFYLEAPSSAAHDLTRFAVSAWVNPSSSPTGGSIRYIVDVQSQYAIVQQKQGDVSCFFINQGGSVVSVSGSGVVPNGVFTHIGCTYGGADLRLYINGVRVKTTRNSNVVSTAKTGNTRIGSNSPEGGDTALQSFQGLVDQVKIYNAASEQRMCLDAFRLDCPTSTF